jgi:hypothetical protein
LRVIPSEARNLKAHSVDRDPFDRLRTGYDEEYGVRPLRRTVEEKIERPLAEQVLAQSRRTAKEVVVDVQDGELVFRAKQETARARNLIRSIRGHRKAAKKRPASGGERKADGVRMMSERKSVRQGV